MNDIYDAVERLSAVLSFSVQKLAGRRGWAAKPFSLVVAPTPERYVMMVSTTVTLPRALSAGFTPLYQPDPGGRSWTIDIRRTDGVVRDSWASGLSIAKAEGRFQITMGPVTLSEDMLDALIEDLGTP